MDQTPQSQPQPTPQNQQAELTSKKGSSLTFQIILTTILVVLGFVAEYFIYSSIFLSQSSGNSLAGFGLIFLLMLTILLGGPFMVISIILIIIAHKNVQKNSKTSKYIAIFYLVTPLLSLLGFIPYLSLFKISFVLFPLVFYDWLFIKIYLEARKSIEEITHPQILAENKKADRFLIQLLLINCKYLLLSPLIYLILIPIFILIYIVFPLSFLLIFFLAMAIIPGLISLLILTSLLFIILNIIFKVTNVQTLDVFIFVTKTLLISAIAFGWVVFRLSSPALCDGCGVGDILLTGPYVMLIPYTIIMLKYGLPKLRQKAKTIFNEGAGSEENSGNSSPINGQNSAAPNADPRFPTLDAQPKPQNTPPDEQKQG